MKTIKVPDRLFEPLLTLLDLAQANAEPTVIDDQGTIDEAEAEVLQYVRKLLSRNGIRPSDPPEDFDL